MTLKNGIKEEFINVGGGPVRENGKKKLLQTNTSFTCLCRKSRVQEGERETDTCKRDKQGDLRVTLIMLATPTLGGRE